MHSPMKILLSLFLGIMPALPAFASLCEGSDWTPDLCSLEEFGDDRCRAGIPGVAMAQSLCTSNNSVCDLIGGCYGSIEPWHWYPVFFNHKLYRCQCH